MYPHNRDVRLNIFIMSHNNITKKTSVEKLMHFLMLITERESGSDSVLEATRGLLTHIQ